MIVCDYRTQQTARISPELLTYILNLVNTVSSHVFEKFLGTALEYNLQTTHCEGLITYPTNFIKDLVFFFLKLKL